MTELEKEIEEQVHARREGAKELLQGKTMLEGDSRRDRLDAEPLEASTAPSQVHNHLAEQQWEFLKCRTDWEHEARTVGHRKDMGI